jgi:hypothetical protein
VFHLRHCITNETQNQKVKASFRRRKENVVAIAESIFVQTSRRVFLGFRRDYSRRKKAVRNFRPFQNSGKFFDEFVQSAASYKINVGLFEFFKLPVENFGAVFQLTFGQNLAQKIRFFQFRFNQKSVCIFARNQTRHGGQSGARADVGEPSIFRQKLFRENRF